MAKDMVGVGAFIVAEILLVCSVVTTGDAQVTTTPTRPITVAVDLVATTIADPKAIAFTHDNRDTTGFALYVRDETGVSRRIDLGPLRPDPEGTVVAPLPALARGVYMVSIAAYNSLGESSPAALADVAIAITESPSNADIGAATAVPPPDPVPPPMPAHLASNPKGRAAAPARADGGDERRTPEQPSSPQQPPAKRGFLGMLWRGVVGD